jgi:methylated-DNA-[protein]-cysteine S-methyltransferase
MMGIVGRPMMTFETRLGRCGVSWSEVGLTAVYLPRAGGFAARQPEEGTAVPTFLRDAIAGMQAVLAGEDRLLHEVPLDERRLEAFQRRVYAAARDIPPGTTWTYGQLAKAIGEPDGARDVGTALSRNPFPIVVPCHRVIGATGSLTGFAAPGGIETKRRMLQLEGAPGFGQLELFA